MAIRRKRLLLSGRVQGVGFRYFAYRLARELGLRGWVRNLRDGNVEIEVQGEEELLDQFLMEIKSGPQLAIVEDISINSFEDLENYEGFNIES
ncbi:MAG TPA: acylphosphatase [Acidobacteriota bacterium]|jgi:acylphosphatase